MLSYLIGDIKFLDLVSKSVVKIEILENQTPTVIRWHPKKENVAAVGYRDGQISFVDVHTL